jgi:metal-responsive CopG/Arc/MetJ family transcriptional regulator
MKRTNIYLAEGQAAALDRVAEAEGVSRAELIRELIDRALGGHPGARDQRMDYLDRLAEA